MIIRSSSPNAATAGERHRRPIPIAGAAMLVTSALLCHCRDASLVLATVTRHIRNAERSARFSPEAEDDYDNGLQAIIETRCAEGIADLRAADRSLRASSEAQFSLPPAGAK